MIRLNILLTVKDSSNIDKVKTLLTELAASCQPEPGCVRYEIYHSQNDESLFIIHEWWESQAALDIHRTAAGYLEIYQPQVIPLVERVPHPGTLLGE